jgi:hypothetical protein
MPKTEDIDLNKCGKSKMKGCDNMGNAIYGLGFIGAAAYYIQHATSFTGGLLGILKAIIWPVLTIIKLMEFLKMQ